MTQPLKYKYEVKIWSQSLPPEQNGVKKGVSCAYTLGDWAHAVRKLKYDETLESKVAAEADAKVGRKVRAGVSAGAGAFRTRTASTDDTLKPYEEKQRQADIEAAVRAAKATLKAASKAKAASQRDGGGAAAEDDDASSSASFSSSGSGSSPQLPGTDEGPRITLLINYWSYPMDGANLITHGTSAAASGRLHQKMKWNGQFDVLSKKAHRRCSPPKLPLEYFQELEDFQKLRKHKEAGGAGEGFTTAAATTQETKTGDPDGTEMEMEKAGVPGEGAAESARRRRRRGMLVEELWPKHSPHDHHDEEEAAATVQALLRGEHSGAVSICDFVISGEASNASPRHDDIIPI